MKVIVVTAIIIGAYVLPSYLLGRWMIVREFKACPSMTSNQRYTMVALAASGGLLMIYPASIAGTMIGMYGPLIVLNQLSANATETTFLPLSIATSLIVFTIVSLCGVLTGKAISKLVIKYNKIRPNQAL